eukprot:12914755-Prorocentrum_lima.AAC.1
MLVIERRRCPQLLFRNLTKALPTVVGVFVIVNEGSAHRLLLTKALPTVVLAVCYEGVAHKLL